jgi:hypothetical protein
MSRAIGFGQHDLLTWDFTLERVTRIELALSAWEAYRWAGDGPRAAHWDVSAGIRECP